MIWKLVLFLLFVAPSQGLCCGYVEDYILKYWQLNDIESKTKFLQEQTCSPDINYLPHNADPVIMKVLVDAINQGISAKIIEKILQDYNCAYGARNEPEYETIRAFITEESYSKFCNLERLQNIHIVDARSGAVLRAGPSVDTERLDAIREGDYVEAIAEEGQWFRVRSIEKQGYIHKSLLTPY